MEYTSIDKFQVGKSINGFFLCLKKHTKTTRLGDLYLDLLLTDKSGTVKAKIWSNVEHFSSKFNEGDIVAVKGSIISFNDKNEISLKFINMVKDNFYDEYGYKNNLIIKTIKEPKDKLVKYIFEKITGLPKTKSLVLKSIYKDKIEKVKCIPLPLENYDMDGGFLLYTFKLIKVYEKISKEYKELDDDKVISCILIANLGYLDYYNLDSTFSLTDKAKKISPMLLGLNIYFSIASKLKTINEEDEIFFNQCLSLNDCTEEPSISFVNAMVNLESVYKSTNKYL